MVNIFKLCFAFKYVAGRGNAMFDGFGMVRFGIPTVKPSDIVDFTVVFLNESLQGILWNLTGAIVMDGGLAVGDKVPRPSVNK